MQEKRKVEKVIGADELPTKRKKLDFGKNINPYTIHQESQSPTVVDFDTTLWPFNGPVAFSTHDGNDLSEIHRERNIADIR